MFTDWFTELKLAPKNWKNTRGDLAAFFNWALGHPRNWIAENPLTAVSVPKVTFGVPSIVTAATAKDLMAALEQAEEGKLCLIYALLLFAGIRPQGEIAKIAGAVKEGRGNIIFSDYPGKIFVPRWVAKNKENRWIPIEPNLAKWLTRYPPIPRFLDYSLYEHNRPLFRERFSIPPDGCRHSFVSFFTEKHGSDRANEAAGHDNKIARTHYKNGGVSAEDAASFWNIGPTL
jgi:integrase